MNNGDHLNGRLNRLLIKVEDPIQDQVQRADIKRMLEFEGIYCAGDTNNPDVTVPLASAGGKLYKMKLDGEIDPSRFLPTVTLAGPYTAQEPDPDAWTAAAAGLPPPFTLVLMWFDTNEIRVGHWNPKAKLWGPPRADRYLRKQPTHWMPLPLGPAGAAPAAGAQERDGT